MKNLKTLLDHLELSILAARKASDDALLDELLTLYIALDHSLAQKKANAKLKRSIKSTFTAI